MNSLEQYQVNVMLVLIGVCGIILLFVYLSSFLSRERKKSLMLLESSAMLLLIADRCAYVFRGNPSTLGWWMVRISNFLVFFLMLVVIYAFNRYLIDLGKNEGGLDKTPRRLKVAKTLVLIGMALVVVSQFTGLYYTFDDMNRYHRASGFILCYVLPMAVLVLQLTVILQYYNSFSINIRIAALMFTVISILAAICQVFLYGVSLNNISVVIMAALLYVFTLQNVNKQLEHANKLEIEFYKEEQKKEHALFEQISEALASAIDAKDKYTHGHSARVAIYATQIAKEAGKPDDECERIYFAALLHDVGKIGVPDAIINKDGRLTDEEFAQIKLHPVHGNRILSRIQLSPYLSIGAHYHHERYDGKGYPEGLKGEDIPDTARIIAVADAYDAMTSMRSYRDAIPQQKVREELVKGMGTQFDPNYAKIMLHLIDLDTEYQMREREKGASDASITRIHCEKIYRDCSSGILLTDKKVKIRLACQPDAGFDRAEGQPSIILFDALDARVHEDDAKRKDLLYFEYCQIRFDGATLSEGARKIETADTSAIAGLRPGEYAIEAVRVKDHALIRISDSWKASRHIIALPDSARFAYISLTGTHCTISDIEIDLGDEPVAQGYIPRIAEEISYIQGCPEGDVPNLQIDGWRMETTAGIPVRDSMTISFHTQSLPTARLVWHCPFVTIFTSDDGTVDGENYREFLLLRLDGENWDSDEHVDNTVRIRHTPDFVSWNAWKEINKQGMDCKVTIRREGNRITCATENQGIALDSETVIKDEAPNVYVGLTGDQCALTNIRISD